MLIKYFEREGLQWRVKADLRRMIEWREMNLAGTWPAFPSCDIIFIRNVMIYFDVPTKRRILDNAHRILKQTGYLFLGSAETTISVHDGFEVTYFDKGMAYRRR